MSDNPAIIDHAAQILRITSSQGFAMMAEAVLAAVEPLIRADALEEAAQVADDEDGQFSYAGQHNHMAMLQQCCREIAAAIRALEDRP